MEVTIDIDESLVPEGYEVVAYRRPKIGECYITGIPNYDHHGLFKSDGNQEVANLILKKKRWRAGIGGAYEYIDSTGRVATSVERKTGVDDRRYEQGNYYIPDSSEAEKAARRVRAAYVGEGE